MSEWDGWVLVLAVLLGLTLVIWSLARWVPAPACHNAASRARAKEEGSPLRRPPPPTVPYTVKQTVRQQGA